jgi:hypothetical protein
MTLRNEPFASREVYERSHYGSKGENERKDKRSRKITFRIRDIDRTENVVKMNF